MLESLFDMREQIPNRQRSAPLEYPRRGNLKPDTLCLLRAAVDQRTRA